MGYKPTDAVLAKVSDDEPIFVLRAQDISAPVVIEMWLDMNPQIPVAKREHAIQCMRAMYAWPVRKVAD